MNILFWLSIALLLYVYVGYPILTLVICLLRTRYVLKQLVEPKISFIIAAYNEERSISQKLENVFSLDYPSELLEIIVASDGSDDTTEAIVSRYASQGVSLLRLPRRGKIYALNDAVVTATGEIIVFSDATSILANQSLRSLAANFADPEIGCVSGSMAYKQSSINSSSSLGENLYWSYEIWLKNIESRTGSITSASGALFAIRKELYQMPFDAGTTDDFMISTAVIEKGFRLVFEPDAIVYEVPAQKASGEYIRKVRLMTRGLRAALLRKKLLNPLKYGYYSISLFSHKILRRLMPLCLLTLFLSSLFLKKDTSLYLFAFVGQIIFYSIAVLGFILRKSDLGRLKFFCIPFYYCLANAAALKAIINLISGKRIELWRPQR